MNNNNYVIMLSFNIKELCINNLNISLIAMHNMPKLFRARSLLPVYLEKVFSNIFFTNVAMCWCWHGYYNNIVPIYYTKKHTATNVWPRQRNAECYNRIKHVICPYDWSVFDKLFWCYFSICSYWHRNL